MCLYQLGVVPIASALPHVNETSVNVLISFLDNAYAVLFIARTQSAVSFVFIFNYAQFLHKLTWRVYSFVLA